MKKLFVLFLLLLWTPAFPLRCEAASAGQVAGDNAVVFLSEPMPKSHEKTIHRIEDYLTGLSTIVSDFTQVAPNGDLTSGKFFLKRPGKMRWQYNPPTPILMVSSGSELVYYDYELEQVSHIPLDQTLIGFLATNPIRFSGTVGITEFSQKNDVIRIGLAQLDKPNDGELTLEFSDAPLLLRNMVIRDATGQITTVSLNHARFGIALDPELFVWRDPRESRRR
jgi:outer membrane lipoprotein-sorting protein